MQRKTRGHPEIESTRLGQVLIGRTIGRTQRKGNDNTTGVQIRLTRGRRGGGLWDCHGSRQARSRALMVLI